MWYSDAYHWLVANGLWTGFMFAVTGTIGAGTVGWIVLKAKKIHPIKLIEEHNHQQKRIADSLDPTKPGGLTEVLAQNKEK